MKPPYGYCGVNTHRYNTVIQAVKMTLWIFVPMLITVACYMKIFCILKTRIPVSVNKEERRCAWWKGNWRSADVGAGGESICGTTQARSTAMLHLLTKRMMATLFIKVISHLPLALHYLINNREDRDSVGTLIVLALHYASTLFHPVNEPTLN